MASLKEKAKKITNKSGIYIFLDKSKKPLYIGRAVNLKRRLVSYWRSDLELAKKEMISLAKDIKIEETNSLLEAIILEANLIKKYWPKYNVKDKDNKSFLYIVIPSNSYPIIVRERELEKFSLPQKGRGKVKIFGPYQSFRLVRNFLKIIRRIFPYSDCQPKKGKPCFNYQIGLCPGVCIDLKEAEKIHKRNVKNISLLLEGKSKRLLEKLKKDYPDKAFALQHIQDITLIEKKDDSIGFKGRIEAFDISHFSGQETVGAMAVFSAGEPDKSEYRLFRIKYSPKNDDLRSLEEMVTRRLKHSEWPSPDIFLIDGGKPQVDFISKILKEKRLASRLVGISKIGGDKLVFPAKTSKEFKSLCEASRSILLSARDEAHRFANNYRKKVYKLNSRLSK